MRGNYHKNKSMPMVTEWFLMHMLDLLVFYISSSCKELSLNKLFDASGPMFFLITRLRLVR